MEEEHLPNVEQTHRTMLACFGGVGFFSLLAILTIEWFNYTEPLAGDSQTFRSVTLFWTLYSLFWLVLGFVLHSVPIRIGGLIILFTTLVKSIFFDSTISFGYCSWDWHADWSLENWIPLVNPYFLTMLCPAIPTMGFAVWINRSSKTVVGLDESIAWKTAGVFGLILLLLYSSIECFQYFAALDKSATDKLSSMFARASLTLFWTFTAVILSLLAHGFVSRLLRIISMLMICLAVLKVLIIDLPFRPNYLVPFLNPYSAPMLFLAITILVLGFFWVQRIDPSETSDNSERNAYRLLGFFGIIFLWLAMSVECFLSIKSMTVELEAWKAQLALSILWSIFAGVLMVTGFVKKSSVLRWIAICLFAVTLVKILAVDMSGVNELYRFGAVFVLALLLAFAAWSYQRFKPET